MRFVVAVIVAGCGSSTSSPQPAPAPPIVPVPAPAPMRAPAPPKPTCTAPTAACTQQPIRICKPDDPERVGAWRYALIGPSFGPIEDITVDELAAAWRGEPGAVAELAATEDTTAALTATLGAGKPAAVSTPPVIDAKHWAIVPAHELAPSWKVITVGGKHPLDAALDALAVPLCGGDKQHPVANIDAAKLTTIAMTGVTAITRGMAKLVNEKGILYPLPAVEPWLASADYVHISNEVSFVPNCDAGKDLKTLEFCAKESYIELLEKSHTKIVEMTGSHLSNYGDRWITHTLEMYDQRGWMYFGGGRDQVEAARPRVIEHHGNKLVFLGCNMVRTTSKVIRSGPDTAACDLDRMGWEVRDYRRRGYIPIVSIQHEEVYRHDPPDVVVRDLRRMAESGAAFVMGSQAHVAHPWDVHYGAYVHYGPGNFYFDLTKPIMRDAANDKLYFHAGKLLTVGHLYTRCEEMGRPRPLDQTERAQFLAILERTLANVPKAKPAGTPRVADDSRERPDSILVRGVVLPFTVRVPAKLAADVKYPLVVGGDDDRAYVVIAGRKQLPADKLVAFMLAKYPIDPAAVTVDGKPYAPKL